MMNLDLTEEQQLLERTVREWGARAVAPRIRELDRAHQFDRNLFPQMAELGLIPRHLDRRAEGDRISRRVLAAGHRLGAVRIRD